jgi:hypothetical protein
MKRIHLFCFCFLLAVTVRAQTTISLSPVSDNTMYSENNNSNGAGQNIFIGVTAVGSIRRALMRFDLSSIPSGATITNATLTLSITKANGVQGIELHKALASWGEGTSDATGNEGPGIAPTTNDATWNFRFFGSPSNWASAGGDFAATISASASVPNVGTVNISGSGMVADLNNWLSSPSTNFGWIFKGTDETGSVKARRFGSRENGSVALQPTLSITYSLVLPVTFVSFVAQAESGKALLHWVTTSEINNNYFIIERSTDGINYIPIGKQDASAMGSAIKEYNFTDINPETGSNYYRLAQYDYDGKVNYSTIVSVNNNNAIATIQIEPDPAQSYINISGIPASTNVHYEIINNLGQIMKVATITNTTIPIGQLVSGRYWLRISLPNSSPITTAFIKD